VPICISLSCLCGLTCVLLHTTWTVKKQSLRRCSFTDRVCVCRECVLSVSVSVYYHRAGCNPHIYIYIYIYIYISERNASLYSSADIPYRPAYDT